jgi:hypothetical protein
MDIDTMLPMSYRLRTLLILMALLPLIMAASWWSVHSRLHRHIERTKALWPVGDAEQPPVVNEPPAGPVSWPIMAVGWRALAAFFVIWYFVLREAQSLHPRTRGYPNYGPHQGSSQL